MGSKTFFSPRFFILSAGILIAGALIFWGYLSPGENPAAPYTGPAEKVRIGNIGEYSILNLVAKERGYFAENGLDAELIEYPSGPPAVADLFSGKIDIAIAAEFVGARNIFSNRDLRILASVDKHEDFQMVVRKNAIASPAYLEGKEIGVTLKGAGEFFLGRFLSYYRIDADDVAVIDMTPAEMTQKIENGQIDAIVIFNTHTHKIQEKMGDEVSVWPIQRSRKVFATAYSTGTYIRNHPDVLVRYLRSLRQAEDYLKGNPEESKEILKHAMNYTDGYIKYIWPNFDFGLGLDQGFLLALEDDARFIIKNKLTEETAVPNYLDYIHFDALTNVKPEAVSIVH